MNLFSVQSYSSDLNDINSSSDNGEYALVGLYDGISVVNVANPSSPIDLGFYPKGPSSMWRDIKTFGIIFIVLMKQLVDVFRFLIWNMLFMVFLILLILKI